MAPSGMPGWPGTPTLARLFLWTSISAGGHLLPIKGTQGQNRVGLAALSTAVAGSQPLQVALGSVLT